FNRVLARWAEHTGCAPHDVRDRFSIDEAYRRHETGKLSDAEFFASLRTSLGLAMSDEQFLDGWNAIFVSEMPGIADLLARASKRLPLYAFSNTNPAHEAHW